MQIIIVIIAKKLITKKLVAKVIAGSITQFI